jgi:HSP20 family protein
MTTNTVIKTTEPKTAETTKTKSVLPPAVHETGPPFVSLQRDINRLFDQFHRGFDLWRTAPWETALGDFNARIDVKDTDTEIVVTAELPGVERKDMELIVATDALTIKGEKKEEVEEKHKGYYRTERYYGLFHRHIPLPCAIEKDKVEATFANGVLKIVMPKSKECPRDTKKVEIK